MLQTLDPHSAYIPAADLREANEPLEGNFEGIGIEFSIQNDTIQVVTPISGGPSEQVGISAGDKIIKINCNVGYMALAGSTRMQSTTILMYAIGLTLLGCDKMRAARG